MATGLRVEDRLDGAANFSSWKARIVLLFQENELWDIVEGTTATPVGATPVVAIPTDPAALTAFTKKDIKAKRILFDVVKDHIIPHVSSKTYVHEMWTALKNLFQNFNENRKMVLREKLKSIKMTKSESVTCYLSRITLVRDELGAVGEVIPSTELVRTALNGVAKPWAVFVEGIVARENVPSWDRLWDDFVQEETRRGYVHGVGSSGVQEDEENVALAAKGKGKKTKKRGNLGGHNEKGKNKKGEKDMSKVRCWACQKQGHYAATCPERKKGNKKNVAASVAVGEFTAQFEQEFSLVAGSSSSTSSSVVWYIDSGASRHMTGVRSQFSELTERTLETDVVLGDDRTVRAAGVGTVIFQRESLPPLKLTDVLYVPGLTWNLVSVSTIEDRGYEVVFRGGQVLLYPKGGNIASARVIGVRQEKLYRMIFQAAGALTCSTSSRDLCEIWHRRMGHLHHGALRILRDIATGLPDFSIDQYDVCRGCAMGKYAKAPFPASDNRSAGILDLIHSDVSGRMSSPSLSGYLYYVLFIDDYSRKTWIYFLKTKGEVFKRFQEFKALVENQTGKKIRCLRSDNGGEYTSKDFDDYCVREGIRREMTVAYNPQQNGVAERKNRSIVGAARAMIHDQGLPLFLWAEACNTAVYLQNRSPHRALGNVTPDEAFTGQKPQVGHLRIFGCVTYSFIPKELRKKMEPTAEKGIFVGYNEVSKAYRIYIPTLKRVVVRRDVKFEEQKAFERSRELDQREPPTPSTQQGSSGQGSGPQGSAGTGVSGVTGSQVVVPQVGSQSSPQSSQQGSSLGSQYSPLVGSTHGTSGETGSVSTGIGTGFPGTGTGSGRAGTGTGSKSTVGQGSGVQSSGVDDEEVPLGKRKPKWLQETLREADDFGGPKRATRESRPPERFCAHMAMVTSIAESEPSSYEEAASQQVWREGMVEEYVSIMENDVWEVVPRPEGKSVVTSRWLYKIKHAADGSIEKYKARFVARGFSQVEGVDYDETFAPVARYSSIRSVVSIAAEMGWKIHQMDVKTAFLNGVLDQEVYVEQPLGFVVHERETHVCRLKRALYGLKQAPRAWYSRIDTYLLQIGFTRSESDVNLYYIVIGGEPLILVLYVDDLFITGAERLIEGCKRDLASEFDMKDIGLMHYFLGLEVWQEEGHIFLGQGRYAVDILSRFNMGDCKPMSTPMITNWQKISTSASPLVNPTLYRQLIGSLMYLVNTRPDICFAVHTLSQFMVEPRQVHWSAAKHVLRYLQGTLDFGLEYVRGDGVRLAGYTDSDWAGSVFDRKSTSGCCFGLGSAAVSWFSRKQKSVALSSSEAEYMAASLACCEAVWLRKMLFSLFGDCLDPTVIYCDNQSCIKLTENPVFHDRSKHIDIRYHSIRDYVQRGIVKLEFVPTDEQVADILTKALPRGKNVHFRDKLGVVRNTFLGKREC
jgi:transposase InsO family protein